MVVSLALIMSSSNLYGYIRCKLGGNFKSVLTQYVGKQIFYNVSYNSEIRQNFIIDY
jgi:hypothetical protein